MTLPVGSIVPSILNLADFKKQMPSTETWELADGTKLAKNSLAKIIEAGGTDYAALNPGNAPTKPNLNGAFLRGRDYSAPTALRNPDGLQPVGTFQTDGVGPHSHPQKVGYANASAMNQGDGWHGQGGDNTGNPNNGLPETRPKNVTVNFFIRVN
ncbi:MULTISPECIES: hypothetical protein [unclassified Bradyrhizobium]|uniref:hypothetical protein n=1 Tax=unclassified Bradyrhizobium TaxID=2631580 RepID=UPI00291673EB|nr:MULTISPECIES: hypothetical protein [unclassified Bradyrhizobium]